MPHKLRGESSPNVSKGLTDENRTAPKAPTGGEVWLGWQQKPHCGALAECPGHSPRTQSSDMAEGGRASAGPLPPLPSAGAAAAPALGPAASAAPHGPQSQQRPSAPSHVPRGSRSEHTRPGGASRPVRRALGAAPRRHRREAGAAGTPARPSSREPGKLLGGAEPRGPAPWPINSRPVHRPRPSRACRRRGRLPPS